MIDRIGRKSLPHWKQEGIPEYIANIGVVKRDSSATLAKRISILNDDYIWRFTQSAKGYGWDRLHYQYWLLTEFLFEVDGFTLEDIVEEDITKEQTLESMLTWFATQQEHDNSF